jgi:phosphatidylserine/phosphatidylglycerophosphate/cardiolipin synthase-like enzyme
LRLRFWVVFAVSATLQSHAPARTLDTCFSPWGHCDQVLISWIKSAARSLDAAVYGLTDPEIARALIQAHQRGVRIRLIRDRTQSKGRGDVTRILTAAQVPVRIQQGSGGGIQHNKFLIIDSTYVLTGSFNWTLNASHKNDENFIVVDDQAPLFQKEFERLWTLSLAPKRRPRPRSRSKKRSALPVPGSVLSLKILSCGASTNPFRKSAT